MAKGETLTRHADGYLRISTRRDKPLRGIEILNSAADNLLFIDIDGSNTVDHVKTATQHAYIPVVRYVLFRWPSRETTADQEDSRASEWLSGIAQRRIFPTPGPVRIGVLVFRVGESPRILWHEPLQYSSIEHPSDEDFLIRCLQVELRSLLAWGRAIWKPRNYHYELPSGDHTDSFVRLADAFRTHRDIEVVASWFYDKLEDGMSILLDSASLLPLVSEFKFVLAGIDAQIVAIETLDEYPRTSLEIQQVVSGLGENTRILAIMSVSASGRYRDMIMHALAAEDNADFVVVVTKTGESSDCSILATEFQNLRVSRWLSVAESKTEGLLENGCALCAGSDSPQVVRIDPRSFQAVALPGKNLAMPDVVAARALADFIGYCDRLEAIDLFSKSDAYNRPKGSPMPFAIKGERLVENQEFRSAVLEKVLALKAQHDLGEFDHVVFLERDRRHPGFEDLISEIKNIFSIAQGSESIISFNEKGESTIEGDVPPRDILLVSLGSVSGWTLRQMLLQVEDSWERKKDVDSKGSTAIGALSTIVVHATTGTSREWENLVQSFQKRLYALWLMKLPQISPFESEMEMLANSEYVRVTRGSDIESAVLNFLDRRMVFLKSGACAGQLVLWGSDEDMNVRNSSLYGFRIRSLAALVAVGAAIHSKRQESVQTDPRWTVFDFASISRSYYDGLLVACMLRWCEPREIWWGDTKHEQETNVLALISRTRERSDQSVLFPELLINLLQGKIPSHLTQKIAAMITGETIDWNDNEKAPVEAALSLLREGGFDLGDDV